MNRRSESERPDGPPTQWAGGEAAGFGLNAVNRTALAESSLGTHDAASEPVARPVLEASRIGRYRILRELGSGGMGIVYIAYDESLDRRVALKLLLRETATTVQRLRREAQAMARISHTNVVQIFEVGEHEGQPFVAMEYIEGVSLTRWLADASLTWVEIIDVFVRAGRGLQAAHEAGVVHRDFKPDNVMIQRAEGGRALRVKVLDFGIAAVDLVDEAIAEGPSSSDADMPPSRLTRAGALMGTPHYMSPEHFLGNATDPRSDQFSFAVALYEALYGQRPFDGDDVDHLRAAVLAGKLRPAPMIADVPVWAFETLARALAVDPSQRWDSMAELLAALTHHPDSELDRSLALPERLWMLSVITLGLFGLLGVLFWMRAHASASGVEEFAFWSKVLFSSAICVGLVAMKHVFLRSSYNRHVFAMLMALALAVVATSISARASDLAAEQADRFVLVLSAAIFGQASATVGKWLVVIPALAIVGLAASFAVPSVTSPTLGICTVLGTGMTVLFWIRQRRKAPAGGYTTVRTSAMSSDASDHDG